MIHAEENVNVVPQCQHCEKDITMVWYQELSGFLGKRYIYFCPHCRAVLGVSHRKGFWMG